MGINRQLKIETVKSLSEELLAALISLRDRNISINRHQDEQYQQSKAKAEDTKHLDGFPK